MEDIKENFSRVYDTYITRIYRFVYLKVSSQEVAEDLSSEVFTRVWKVYRRETVIEHPQAYLYRVARTVVADYYRGQKVQISSIEEISQEPLDPAVSLDYEAEVKLEIDRVLKVVKALQSDYQDLIIWRYIDELSVPEIAQITGKKEENVRVGIHRALQALKAQMPEKV